MGSPGLLRRKKRGSQRRGNCATTPIEITGLAWVDPRLRGDDKLQFMQHIWSLPYCKQKLSRTKIGQIANIYPASMSKIAFTICSSPDGICAFSTPHQRLGFFSHVA